jgi:hypothetical protein
MRRNHVLESTTISVPGNMPIVDRLIEVRNQIVEWLQSMEKPLCDESAKVFLTRYERKQDQHRYHYAIIHSVHIDENPLMVSQSFA